MLFTQVSCIGGCEGCDGDEIVVHPGTYVENIDFNDTKITLRSTDPNDWEVIAATIIDGNNNGSVVIFDSGDADSTITGFTITDSNATYGGGIYCYSVSPTISNCVIAKNVASYGGGMYCEGTYSSVASPTIRNCIFSRNRAMWMEGGSWGQGGGMCIHYYSSPIVVNCVFSGNEAYQGGGIETLESSPTIINCTFSGNSARWGSGMCNSTANVFPPNVTNCIFWGNSGSEIYDECDVLNATYCDIKDDDPDDGSVYPGTGNIDDDPCFWDAGDPAGMDGVFGTWDDGLRLWVRGPCVDAGDGDAAPEFDITGRGRIDVPYVDNGGAGYADMGAYESPTIWFVDAEAVAGANDGSSWDNAFVELQDGLAEATDGNEIWVADGNYTPISGNDRSVSFELVENVGVYGGFAGGETGWYQRNRTANKTTLSGDIGTLNEKSDNSYHVVEGADGAVLDGFTITLGNADGSDSNSRGGGIYCYSVSPTISNCVIADNNCSLHGAGMYNYSCSPRITNCFFIGNAASNSVGSCGGMANSGEGSEPEVTGCVFSGNSARFGAGVCNVSRATTFTNCTFSSNNAGQAGGGMWNSNCNLTVTNCIIWGNTASCYPEICNNNSSPSVTYCDVKGGYAGAGNIDSDPCFANINDPDGADDIFGTFDDGLRLDWDSPCIDAGDGDVARPTDMLSYPRFDYNSVDNNGIGDPNYADMGAYEFYPKLVHFCDWWIANRFDSEERLVIAFADANYSDILEPNEYPDTNSAIPTVRREEGEEKMGTLDSIAIHAGTRVIIYDEDPNDVLLDQVGPAIIYNVRWKGERYDYTLTEKWDEPFQTEFPPRTRLWSETDMTDKYQNCWTNGSMKIE